jgi:hypothetical protein
MVVFDICERCDNLAETLQEHNGQKICKKCLQKSDEPANPQNEATCKNCGCDFDIKKSIVINGEHCCQRCALICHRCGNVMRDDLINSRQVCPQCSHGKK